MFSGTVSLTLLILFLILLLCCRLLYSLVILWLFLGYSLTITWLLLYSLAITSAGKYSVIACLPLFRYHVTAAAYWGMLAAIFLLFLPQPLYQYDQN